MIIVTGGAGFIGSNLVRALNDRGRTDVTVVDDMTDGRKFENLRDCEILDYLDVEDFHRRISGGQAFGSAPEAVMHQGACTDTMETDGKLVMARNYAFSRDLLDYCAALGIPLIYASSAAVYGAGRRFAETPECESPVNVYGYSKLLFDQHVRRRLPGSRTQIAGLRYFNVYGPREQCKGRMASMVYRLHRQAVEEGTLRLFRGSGGFGDGEQSRDFVHVDDVVRVNLWLLENSRVSGIFNVGTGRARTFNDLAARIIARRGAGRIEYIDFPPGLEAGYQSFTCADLTALRAAGYSPPFKGLEEGVAAYLDWLSRHEAAAGNRRPASARGGA